MIDTLATLRTYLIDQPALYALTAERIFASTTPPPGYKPSDGPAVLFNVRGGGQDYSSKVLNPSLQFRCYGLNQSLAIQTDRALYDALNDRACGNIKITRLETPGQLLTEPDTGWWFVLSFYRSFLNND